MLNLPNNVVLWPFHCKEFDWQNLTNDMINFLIATQ